MQKSQPGFVAYSLVSCARFAFRPDLPAFTEISPSNWLVSLHSSYLLSLRTYLYVLLPTIFWQLGQLSMATCSSCWGKLSILIWRVRAVWSFLLYRRRYFPLCHLPNRSCWGLYKAMQISRPGLKGQNILLTSDPAGSVSFEYRASYPLR